MSNIVVPQLGESVVEARVARWLKKQGDRVEVGEPIVELETEKIDLEVSAEKSGVIASIARKEGEDVKIGELLAVVDESGTAASSAPSSAPAPPPAAAAAPATQASAPAPGVNGSAGAATDSRATPTARRMAKDNDVDLGTVQGSGAAGRVRKQDVQKAIGTPAPASSAVAPPSDKLAPTGPSKIAPTSGTIAPGARTEDRVRMTKRRQTIARRLVEAQQTAAMLTTFNEVDMSAVMALRERRKESFKKEFGVGLGIASFFVKSAIAALRAFPELN